MILLKLNIFNFKEEKSMLNFLNLFFHKIVNISKKSDKDKEKKKLDPSHIEHLNRINIEKAIQIHLEWRDKLLKEIKKTTHDFDITKIKKDNCCKLGQWLYEEIPEKFKDNENYKSLKIAHKQFHEKSAEILIDIENNEKEKAQRKIKQNLEQLSDLIVLYLLGLSMELI